MNTVSPSEQPAPSLDLAIRELRSISLLADLTHEQLAWLAGQAIFRDYESGEIVGFEGAPADVMWIVIKGVVRGKREQRVQSAEDTWLYTWKTGQVSGTLPYSRMTSWPVTMRAMTPARLVIFSTRLFPELPIRIPVLAERLVHVMVDRARLHVRDEEQNQSLLALGKIAAGLAHELYNPTAAVQRGARELRQRFNDFRHSSINLAHHNVQDDALRVLATLNQGRTGDPAMLDPFMRSESLERLGEWLDDRSVPNAWALAETFLDAGFKLADLEQLEATFPAKALGDGLVWLDTVLVADSLLQDMENASTRAAGLVDSVKSYSYMDRDPERSEIDIHAALEDTLKILTHKIRDKRIDVKREYDASLPRAPVHPAEMNQVWTNLLDNAIDALDDCGQIIVRTVHELQDIVVEIIDNGPGIPEELQSRVWEPFFTTKDVGKGTGLGLEIVWRIVVRRHQGEISLESEPGRTRFQVRLPVAPDHS